MRGVKLQVIETCRILRQVVELFLNGKTENTIAVISKIPAVATILLMYREMLLLHPNALFGSH
jgi:hypothetical protein